jgi:predicted small lipoprotein YifL
MKIRFAGLFLLASMFLLSACGQKGPLYLKKEPAPAAAAVDVEKAADDGKTESTDAEVKSEKKD